MISIQSLDARKTNRNPEGSHWECSKIILKNSVVGTNKVLDRSWNGFLNNLFSSCSSVASYISYLVENIELISVFCVFCHNISYFCEWSKENRLLIADELWSEQQMTTRNPSMISKLEWCFTNFEIVSTTNSYSSANVSFQVTSTNK